MTCLNLVLLEDLPLEVLKYLLRQNLFQKFRIFMAWISQEHPTNSKLQFQIENVIVFFLKKNVE